jgi:hypothetical protein
LKVCQNEAISERRELLTQLVDWDSTRRLIETGLKALKAGAKFQQKSGEMKGLKICSDSFDRNG